MSLVSGSITSGLGLVRKSHVGKGSMPGMAPGPRGVVAVYTPKQDSRFAAEVEHEAIIAATGNIANEDCSLARTVSFELLFDSSFLQVDNDDGDD